MLETLPELSLPKQHSWTVSEYHRMVEVGLLRPDARVELLGGQIIDMSPIGPFHGSVTNQLSELFFASARGRWTTIVQNPVSLDDHSEPQPDITLAKRSADFYRKHHPAPNEVFLAIEVSDTTLELDRTEKIPAYGRFGIQEVWIVNLVDRVVEVHREPNFSGYSNVKILRPGDKALPLAFPDIMVDIAQLLNI